VSGRKGWGAALNSPRVKDAVAAARAKDTRPRGKLSHSALCSTHAGEPCSCGASARRTAQEDALARELESVGIVPTPGIVERDVPFIPGRLFRGDFVFPAAWLVVEVQGWAGGFGPHGGIAKAKADVEKHALAAAHGWRVLPVTRDTIRSGEALRLILAALTWAPEA